MASDSSVVESLEELDSSDSGSIYEPEVKALKKKRNPTSGPSPKKPRRNATLKEMPCISSSANPSPGNPFPLEQAHLKTRSRSVPEGSRNKRNQGISASEVYDAICSGKAAIVTVVDEWLDSYKQSREGGLLVLINFIVQSCGCKGVVTREMFGSMQNAEIISTLTKEFNETSGNYPLSTPGPRMKHFKAGLCEFCRVLVRSCHNSILYDEYVFPSLLSLLTGLSDSQVRAFRHTSTLLAMKVMTGLVEVAVTVSVQLQTTQRQIDTEKRKNPQIRASDKLEELHATINELKENREEVCSMMNTAFRGVFVHRYRDLLPEIRAICIEELGVWLNKDPEDFLNDGYLKYLGWTLFDKQSAVRLQCVRALQCLYKEKEFIGRLELFTSRFKERILSMVLDKEPDVALEAVNLLLLIQQMTEEGLSEEECSRIYPLVYAAHRGLATAGGAFLYNKFQSLISKEDQENNNASFFYVLISFHTQNGFHEHGAYLVDSLWSVAASELMDWKTMTALLLQDVGLMYEEEGVLLEIMMCAVRQAVQGTPPVGRTQARKIVSVKDKKIQEQDRSRITTHFIPILPQLLAKYSADAKKVSILLKAPLYFDLKMYSSSQWLKKNLDLLLSQVCGIVEKHTDVTVLQACALLTNSLCSENYTFSSRAHLVFSQLLDELVECFNSHFAEILQGGADEEDTYTAATALKKIAVFSSARDPTGWKLFDSCLQLLNSRLDCLDLYSELTVSALKCAGFHLMWARVNLNKSKPKTAELKLLKKDVCAFCRISQTCLSVDKTEIRDEAFELLCDLLQLYSESSVRSEPALQKLVHVPSVSLCSELTLFLLDHVFTDEEDAVLCDEREEEIKMSLFQKRRRQLAGYCKLVLHGVLDLSAATNVFKHYSKFFKDFGDIIKETISKSKLINPVQSAKTVCLCLQQMFSEMLTDNPNQQDLTEIRNLAKKLAMTFGIDLKLIRKPLVALHLDGINFAFRVPQGEDKQLPNADFLEILSEFSFKLLQQDRVVISEFLKSECPSAALSWPSVKHYQCSLESRSAARFKEQEVAGSAISRHHTPQPKRRRTSSEGSTSSTTKGPWLESSSIHSRMHTPVLTSTVQKQAVQLQQQQQQPPPPPSSTQGRATESDATSGLAELESEDDFSSGMLMRKVNPTKRSRLISAQTAAAWVKKDIASQLTLLSLIEDDISEREEGEDEPDLEDSENESQSSQTLPSTRHTSVSVLDDLFD